MRRHFTPSLTITPNSDAWAEKKETNTQWFTQSHVEPLNSSKPFNSAKSRQNKLGYVAIKVINPC